MDPQAKEICLDIFKTHLESGGDKLRLSLSRIKSLVLMSPPGQFSVRSVSVQENKIKPFSLQHTDMDN